MAQREFLYSVQDNVNVRGAPSETAPILRHLALAERVVASERNGDWVKLGTRERDEWVHGKLLSRARPETPREKAQRLAQERERVAAETEARAVVRRMYASTLREKFLDAGLDVKVRISGDKADRMTLECVLFTDVWAHRYRKDGLLQQAKDMGFRRVDMTDGFDYHVYWNLE